MHWANHESFRKSRVLNELGTRVHSSPDQSGHFLCLWCATRTTPTRSITSVEVRLNCRLFPREYHRDLAYTFTQ